MRGSLRSPDKIIQINYKNYYYDNNNNINNNDDDDDDDDMLSRDTSPK